VAILLSDDTLWLILASNQSLSENGAVIPGGKDGGSEYFVSTKTTVGRFE